MGKYVSFSFSTSQVQPGPELIEALQLVSNVHLVGAFCYVGSSYCLTGRGVESFASHALLSGVRPREIRIVARHCDERTSLEHVAKNMFEMQPSDRELVSNEQVAEQAGVTTLESGPVETTTAIPELLDWLEGHRHATVEPCVTLDLRAGASDLNRVYRELFPSNSRAELGLGFPVLRISSSAASVGRPSIISLNSRSHLWLRDGQHVRDGVLTYDDVDHNLHSLAKIGGEIVKCFSGATEIALKLDGTAFTRESKRIYEAFLAEVPELSPEVTW